MVERIKAEVPNLTINSWFLDDGTLMGSPEDLTAALNIVEAEGPALGLHLNRSKSLLFIPQEEDSTVSSLPSEIPITRQGFTLLGCPIAPPSFCEASLLHQVERIKAALNWSTGRFSAGDNIAPILSVSSQAFLHPSDMPP